MKLSTIFTAPFKSTLVRGAPQGNEQKRHWSHLDEGWWAGQDPGFPPPQPDLTNIPRGPFVR